MTTGPKKNSADAHGLRGQKRKQPRGTLSEQKSKSRTRLLAVARQLGIEGRLQSASIDDIARQSKLSRAAFYLHFKNKEELTGAVLKDQMGEFLRDYRTVTPQKVATRSGVIGWFNQIISRFERTGELTPALWSSMPLSKLNKDFHEARCASVEILGHRLPTLRLFKHDGSIDPGRQMEIFLFVHQLEQVTFALSTGRSYIDSTLALDKLADHFFALMSSP